MIVPYGIIIIIKTLYNVSCLVSYENTGNFTVYNICPMSTNILETSLSSCLMS